MCLFHFFQKFLSSFLLSTFSLSHTYFQRCCKINVLDAGADVLCDERLSQLGATTERIQRIEQVRFERL